MYIMDSEIKFSISTKFSSAKATLEFNCKKKTNSQDFIQFHMTQIFHCSNLPCKTLANLKLQMGSMITAQNIPIILILWSKSRAKSQ